MTGNTYFEGMKRIGHDWEEKRAVHQAKKQGIIDTYGWDSEELKAWYEEKEANKFPFTQGENKAYRAYAESLRRKQDTVEMSDFLFDTEVKGFSDTMKAAGVTEFIYTNTSTAVMENLHAFAAEGMTLAGLCTITRHENRWGGRGTLRGTGHPLYQIRTTGKAEGRG